MKKIVFLIVVALFILTPSRSQILQATWNIANYQAYDSTTLFLGAVKDKKWITIECTSLSANDAELRVGSAVLGKSGLMAGYGTMNFWLDGATTAQDSVILNATTATKKFRRADGTRVTTIMYHLWFPYGIPTEWVAFQFYWNALATGTIKIYY